MLFIAPIYSNSNLTNFFRAWQNKEARINIFFGDDKDNQLQVVDLSKNVKSEQPEWYNNPSWMKTPGRGTMVLTKIHNEYQKFELSYQAIGNGTVSIYLAGPDYKEDNGKFYPIWVYYKNFKVNGKEIFAEAKKLSYEHGYQYSIPLKNGEILKIEFETKKFIPLNLFSGIESLLFISCLAISFLLSRMMVYWLSKFKIKEHHSRIDIVFLSVFFVLLMIPMLHINQAEKSLQENRMLAKYVPLIDNQGHINLKFGKNFEAWFNDRFNFRNDIIRLYNTLQYKLSQHFSGKWKSMEIYFAKDGWMFDNNETKRFLGFNQTQTNKTIQNFKKLKTFFDNMGIKFYFFISPTAGDIYSEYNIRYLAEEDKTSQFVKDILNGSGIQIYYPREKYFKAKANDMIFYKTDHHSTEYATWIAYQDISAQIKQDFPEYHIVSLDEYSVEYDNHVRFDNLIHQGVSAERINVNVSNLLDTQYKYFIPHNKSNISINKVSTDIYDYRNKKAPNNLRIMLIGNSFTENFVKFIPYSVKEMRKFRTNVSSNIGFKMSIIAPEIQKYKPNIVIFVTQSSWIGATSTGNLPGMYD